MDRPTFDKVPGYNLYIGGFISLRRPKALENCHITHIVSVIDWHFDDDSPLVRGFQHLHIPVDDVEDENLITWFPRSNAFIEEGLNIRPSMEPSNHDTHPDQDGGVSQDEQSSGVLIHCAMGKSRSSTILLAYLLWSSRRHHRNQLQLALQANTNSDADTIPLPPKPLSVVEALTLLRQGRPIAEPNEGFMDQLHLYERMRCPDDVENHPIYQRWLSRKQVQESLNINRAPEMDIVRFEDEHEDEGDHKDEVAPGIYAPDGTSDRSERPSFSTTTIKCRKCRRLLLSKSSLIIPHDPPSGNSRADCAHVFIHPLSWMKTALSAGQLDGRLTCPNDKCAANIGKFAWQGMRCSCGEWVTPAFAVGRSKVDEVKGYGLENGEVGLGSTGIADSQVRLPPGLRKGSGKGNL